jgi:cytochrome c oxidase assembly protein subunit 11
MLKEKKIFWLALLLTIIILIIGLAYGSVPIYRIFCQLTGYGGTTQIGKELINLNVMDQQVVDSTKIINISFETTVYDNTQWKFTPCQKEVKVLPGQTALVFFKVENLTDKPVIGTATYNVIPAKAGLYFNKIQCFCFEQQQFNPKESIEIPIFFFLDPIWYKDKNINDVNNIVLSYTFFSNN